jgi:hypothetical protein
MDGVMNWLGLEAFIGVSVWAAPLLIFTFAASRVKWNWLAILFRVLYVPYFVAMMLPAFWFWGGDGEINFFLAPVVLVALQLAFIKYLKPQATTRAMKMDHTLFYMSLSGYLTVWIMVLAHAAGGQPLAIH